MVMPGSGIHHFCSRTFVQILLNDSSPTASRGGQFRLLVYPESENEIGILIDMFIGDRNMAYLFLLCVCVCVRKKNRGRTHRDMVRQKWRQERELNGVFSYF